MMTPEEQIKQFETHVKKIVPKFNKKTSSLRSVFKIIEEQAAKQKIVKLDGAEISKLVKLTKSDGTEKFEKLKPALDALVAVWGSSHDYGSSPREEMV